MKTEDPLFMSALDVISRIGKSKEIQDRILTIIDRCEYVQTPFGSIEDEFLKKGIDHRCLVYQPKIKRKLKHNNHRHDRYKQFSFADKSTGKRIMIYHHRLMYAFFNARDGESIASYPCDHLCNNRLCLNPSHLVLVSQKENSQAIHERKQQETRYFEQQNKHIIVGSSKINFGDEQTNIFKDSSKQEIKNTINAIDINHIFDDL